MALKGTKLCTGSYVAGRGQGRAVSCSEGLSQPRGNTERHNMNVLRCSGLEPSGGFCDNARSCLQTTTGPIAWHGEGLVD
jgi:hypothetical protein